MNKSDSVKSASLPLAVIALLLGACSGFKPLPEQGQYDPSPKLRGGLTGDESIMKDTVGEDLPTAKPPRTAKASSGPGLPASYRDIPSRPATFDPPLLSSRADTLPNGTVVYWVEDAQLPLASLQFFWREGVLGQSAQAGLESQLLGALLRQGGAGKLSARQVDDTLETLGADISISVGGVGSTVQVQGFSRDLPYLLDLLGDMLHRPQLDTARLATIKTETMQSIEHRLDAPAQVLEYAWGQVQYGPSAWTRHADSAQVARATQAALRAQLPGRFAAKGCMIAVAGKFDRAAVRQKLVQLLSGTSDVKLVTAPALPPQQERGVWIAPVEATQAFVKIGTRFVKRDHPDYYPLMLACQTLGSGFGTRLVDRIRSDEGLAYHVAAFAGSDYDRTGVLGVNLQTKSESAHRAIALVFEEIRKLRDSGFLPGELDKARKGLKASIPSLFDTPEATAEMFAQSASWGRQDNHFRNYQRALDTIPESVVLETFRRYFKPEELRIVVAGPKDALLGTPADGSAPLSSYGPVHVLSKEDLLKDDGK